MRGVRLYQDFIPATMPDGQGQTGSFSLLSAKSIEVLRGPFSTLYGNASGGVISVFTEDATAQPVATASVSAGSYTTYNAGVKASGIGRDGGLRRRRQPFRHRRLPRALGRERATVVNAKLVVRSPPSRPASR